MKIGLVRRGYSASGGAERYLLRFAEAMKRAGHDALLFGSEAWPPEAWPGQFIQVGGTSPARFADALRRLNPRTHCDLLFSLERVWECDAYRAGDGVHRAWLDRRGRFESPWKRWFRAAQPKHREILALEKALFAPAGNRLIIANSKMVAAEITRYFRLPAERIRVIYNGLPAPIQSLTPGIRREMRAKLNLKEATPAALFAGSGWERKGLRFAMEAINRTKDATLLVAGTGKRLRLPSSPRTQFLGAVSNVPDLMEAADLFLLPTLYDPFSNACLEAMAAGLPVITTSANGFSEVMRPNRDGEILQNPSDIKAIAAAIEEWTSPEKAESRDDRRLQAARYTMEENVRATLGALAEAGNFEIQKKAYDTP